MPKKEYVPQTYDPIQLAYLAGIIDGEGCFTIYKVPPAKYNRFQTAAYRASLTISNTRKELMDWLDENFKNLNQPHKAYMRTTLKKQSRHDKMIYEWTIQSFRLVDIGKQVLPYLVIKKKQCEIILAFRDTFDGINNFGSHRGADPEILQKREELRLALRTLNAKTLFRPIHTD